MLRDQAGIGEMQGCGQMRELVRRQDCQDVVMDGVLGQGEGYRIAHNREPDLLAN